MVDPGGEQCPASNQELADDECRDQAQNQRKVVHQEGWVKQHADGHEEEGREEISEGDNLSEDLTIEFRLGDNEASEKGAKRKGEPRFFACQCRAERDKH